MRRNLLSITSLIRSYLEGFRSTNKIKAIASKHIQKGTQKAIHPPKLIACSPTKYTMATALSVDPIGVSISLMFAANDIHKTGAVLPKRSFGKSRRTGFTIGIIKAVVPLLFMNIETNCCNDHYPEHDKFWRFSKRPAGYTS